MARTTPSPTSPSWTLRLRVLALRACARLLPGWVAGQAADLFFSVPRHPRPAAEQALLDRGRPLSWQIDGETVRGHRWGEGPNVLLLHGWGGRGSQLGGFIEPLSRAGYAVVAVDLPGHGDSPAATTSLPRFARTARALLAELDVQAVVAHSLGGLAALAALAHSGRAVPAVIIGAPAGPAAIIAEFLARLGLPAALRPRLQAVVEARVAAPMAAYEAEALCDQVRAPVLVVHDQDDKEVPAAESERLRGRRFHQHRTRGLGHRRILRDEAVIGLACRFIAAPTVQARAL